MDKLHRILLERRSQTYASYYNGRMSYRMHSHDWAKYVEQNFPDISSQQTSENVFKTVIDLYADAIMPVIPELAGLAASLVPLLSRGQCPVIVDDTGQPSFPEHYEMISDGIYSVAAVFSRSLREGLDYVTFVDSDGQATLWEKAIPEDLGPASRFGYRPAEESSGYTLIRLALDDQGLGPTLAALQDRLSHSEVDLTIISEMYARPFWFLLNTTEPPPNPYAPDTHSQAGPMQQSRAASAGRVFTTSSEGPFGQLEPPTITDMIAYRQSILDSVVQSTGIPPHYLKPGSGVPPTGVALKTISRRFSNKVQRLRNTLAPQLRQLCELIGVSTDQDPDQDLALWPSTDDLLQDSLDTHGLALTQMGYPIDYVATVVTPGVDLDEYRSDLPTSPVGFA